MTGSPPYVIQSPQTRRNGGDQACASFAEARTLLVAYALTDALNAWEIGDQADGISLAQTAVEISGWTDSADRHVAYGPDHRGTYYAIVHTASAVAITMTETVSYHHVYDLPDLARLLGLPSDTTREQVLAALDITNDDHGTRDDTTALLDDILNHLDSAENRTWRVEPQPGHIAVGPTRAGTR